MRSLPPFHDTASYVFQRLEPVKEQLAMVQLPPVLDAACKEARQNSLAISRLNVLRLTLCSTL